MNNNRISGIVVDAGHGGADPGAVSGNLLEKDLNLKAANYMYDRFQDFNIPVVITRDTDETLSRGERINTMLSLGNTPDVLVLSNHINAGGGEGAEVVYPLRTSSVLPTAILDEIGAKGQIKRKVYQRPLPENPSRDYYYIMRDTPNATTLLIEYGFIDNSKDRVKLQNNLLDYVEGVVKAVVEYAGIPYSPPNMDIDGDVYIVKPGDTLYSIARKYNVNLDDLIKLNNLDSNNIGVGTRLIIPSKEINEEYITYIVKPGDTLYSIANNNNLSINDIIEYNKLETSVISPNQVIKIPKKGIINSNTNYIVKPGDTLYYLANLYNVSVDSIKTLNNLSNNTLSIGQELIIPTNNISETDYIVYEVKKGDNLYNLAKTYNTSVNAIKAYNNLNSNDLKVGQILQIPSLPIEESFNIYTVNSGDTLFRIARLYNKTVSELRDFNNLTSDILSIGQIIRIPD